ncbi:GNAT family N-acetyltransferase [Neptunomonas sp. XY-337]|uniref:tRNA(Met) cytidine acetyltransferase TmcA n=1 Tax=Neptunomonas sp. XY-337 TaxID=2561897 RepID=UPI0010A9E6CE|nr:GNAT family N-acetyltransferase [Neptunomonas sp. XY-337]
MPEGRALLTSELYRLRRLVQSRNQRFALWVTGERAFLTLCLNEIRQSVFAPLNTLTISPIAHTEHQHHIVVSSPNQLKRLLGQEFDVVLYDASCGINPDALGQLSGMVRGGGGFILLSSPSENSTFFADPEKSKLTVEPYTESDVGDRFLQRMAHVMQTHTAVSRIDQTHGVVSRACFATGNNEPNERGLKAQSCVVETLWQRINRAPGIATLTAERGRGKSAALGLVAQRALKAGRPVMLTAPDRGSITSVLKFAGISHEGVYLPPHEMLAAPRCDLLLVDEAAAIPSYYLHQLVDHAPHVILATTTQGYEGTGQGFALRFMQWLRDKHESVTQLSLSAPIRWAEGDPLEDFFNQLLLLDASARRQQTKLTSPSPVSYQRISRQALGSDESTLIQLFGLLIDAHYRTTPGDLRILLDSPNMSIWLAKVGDDVVAACLIAEEGELPEQLAMDIWRGRRRPRGHLAPQLLIAQAGHQQAGRYRYWRVVRIAVQDSMRRQGIAAGLLQHIEAQAVKDHVDFVAASFGASPQLQHFWQTQAFRCARLGTTLDTASGSFALLVLKPLNEHAASEAARWEGHVGFQLAYGQATWMQNIAAYLDTALLPKAMQPGLSWCNNDIEGFCFHHRTYESVAASIKLLVGRNADQLIQLNERTRQLLEACANQQTPQQIIQKFGLQGKRDFVAQMRNAAKDLYPLIASEEQI